MNQFKYILKGRDAVPTDNLTEWAEAFEKKNRIIARTTLPNGVFVSTVFLGLNHSFGDEGPPLLFETMAFEADSKGLEMGDFTDRYSTYDEAEAGHERIVALVKTKMG